MDKQSQSSTVRRLKEGLHWLPKEIVEKHWGLKNKLPIKEIKLIPFYISNMFEHEVFIESLLLGILKASIPSNEIIKKVKRTQDVDISKQHKYYKQFLLEMSHDENGKKTEGVILELLSIVGKKRPIDFVLPFYMGAVELMPTSKILADYMTTLRDFLYEHLGKRNKEEYKKLRDIFKKIKREDVHPVIWENLVVTDYCLAQLLEEDVSKYKYIDDIQTDNYKKAIEEQTPYNILFAEEYF